ncbi:DUF4265 domain-containing protein [Dyella psychrodurans]|uniref:DUF4265 domain-containing protein n=1 Tax=Dyella psychrodurans TaxID=1927960 RepID=A0A370X789_9GAMM|nr:DUF4265 domain-containing protein [Dyella psychrodurans]RDS84065.1 DUF4265 domain-containing protein [Dyella psychrodurans]
MSHDATAKVLFRVPDDDGDATVETLWATPLGNDRYKLCNSPFFAYGVSWEDIVLAPYDAQEGFPTFQAVIEKSGNRTIRIIFDSPASPGNASHEILHELVALGCSYEGAKPTYIAINIPPDVALEQVRSYLVEKKAQWEHADPSYASLFPDET